MNRKSCFSPFVNVPRAMFQWYMSWWKEWRPRRLNMSRRWTYQTGVHEKTHTRNFPPVQKTPLPSYDASSSLFANIFHLGTRYENTQETFLTIHCYATSHVKMRWGEQIKYEPETITSRCSRTQPTKRQRWCIKFFTSPSFRSVIGRTVEYLLANWFLILPKRRDLDRQQSGVVLSKYIGMVLWCPRRRIISSGAFWYHAQDLN